MSDSKQEGALVVWIERFLGGVAFRAYTKPWHAWVLLLGLSMLAWAGVKRLHIDADLSELLPNTFESVLGLEEIKQRFGGVGYVVVVGQGAKPEDLKRFAEDVVPVLNRLPSVRYVDYKRPVSFFEEKALYYFDTPDLEEGYRRLQQREAYERKHLNPLYLDLEEEEPPSLDFKDLSSKYSTRGDQAWMRGQVQETYYIDPHTQTIALLVKPSQIASDLTFSRQVVDEVKGALGKVDLRTYGAGMRVEYTGRYVKRVDQHVLVSQDLRLASTVAFVLVALYYVVHFRRVLAVLFVMLPLSMALLWTYGFAGFYFSSLNILTAFIGAILVGLGDHGIHLLTRFEHDWGVQHNREKVVRDTFGETGRAVAAAGLTMTMGFAALGLSDFRAFKEFGLIAACGMVFVVVGYLTAMPALLGVATRWGWVPYDVDMGLVSPFAQALPRWSKRLVWVSVAVTALCALGLFHVRFNYDFASLEDNALPSFKLDAEVNRILGYSQTPVVILTENIETEREVVKAIRSVKEGRGEKSTIDFVAAAADLVPLNQQEKQPVLARIGELVNRVDPDVLKEEQQKQYHLLKKMTQATPFTSADLPLEVKRQFYGVSGKDQGGFVLVFPRISLSDGKRVREFAQELRSARVKGSFLKASGEAMIMADIIDMVSREGPTVLSITCVAVFFTLWLLLGSLKDASYALFPSVITLVVTLGLLPAIGLDLNYLNIIMIPILFGMVVDGSAHIMTRLSSGQGLDSILKETGRAIVGAIVTTVFGFGALMLADHKGLYSLGMLAVLGLCVNLLVCIVMLPAVITYVRSKNAP
jgi:predicted RND superfamily exporter protein